MQYSEFIDRVQEQAGLATREEARRTTEAVLETLGERLHHTERGNLGAQLPNELTDMLSRRLKKNSRRDAEDRFRLEEFYKRVSARLDVRYEPGVERTQAVIAVLREAVSEGEIENVLSDIPSEYRELFAV